MVQNQLFRISPDIDVVISLLETFGLTSLNDTNFFTKKTLEDNDTVTKISEMRDKLEEYYLPCKSMYVKDITSKRCIVILRQFIRVHDYTLISKEKYINSKKVSIYRLIESDKDIIPSKKKAVKPITISFK